MAQFKRVSSYDVDAVNHQMLSGQLPNTRFYVFMSEYNAAWNPTLPMATGQVIKEVLEGCGCTVLHGDDDAVQFRYPSGEVATIMRGMGLLVEVPSTLGDLALSTMEEETDDYRDRLVEVLNEYLNEKEGETTKGDLDPELLGLASRLIAVALGDQA